jgi:hypothetical protein
VDTGRRGYAHTRLLAVVAEALSRGANFSEMANVATFKASTTGERRHGDKFVGLLRTIVSTAGYKRTIVRSPLPEDLPTPMRGLVCSICL